MIGKLLERWINRYYRKDLRHRSVMLIQGEQNDTLVKVCGTKNNLKLNLYIAMIRNEDIREMVLEASELYRNIGDTIMECNKRFLELSKRREETSK